MGSNQVLKLLFVSSFCFILIVDCRQYIRKSKNLTSSAPSASKLITQPIKKVKHTEAYEVKTKSVTSRLKCSNNSNKKKMTKTNEYIYTLIITGYFQLFSVTV